MIFKGHRILATISPEVESIIYSDHSADSLYDFFSKSITFFKYFKQSTFFLIPREALGVMAIDRRLRTIKDCIETDTQSNIIFCSKKSIDECNFNDINDIIDGDNYSTVSKMNILSSLYNNKFPIIFDIKSTLIKKIYCESCSSTRACKNEYDFISNVIPSSNEYSIIARKLYLRYMNVASYNLHELSEINLKEIIFFNCILYNIDSDYLECIENIFFTKNFINDINKYNINDLSKIAFAAFRACAFPSSTGTEIRHEYSIDWHRNDPFTIDGFNLYRVDVVDPTRSGVKGSSGVERILMCKKDGKTFFNYYTNKHDFDKKSIRIRLNKI